MNWLVIISFVIYTLVITGFRVGSSVFASRWVKGEWAELIFWTLFALFTVIFLFIPIVGRWMLLFLFSAFNFGQFFMTYKYWFIRDKERVRKKVAGYNKYFAHTHHIIKPRDDILVPDTFHIMLFLMFFINFIAMVVHIFVAI